MPKTESKRNLKVIVILLMTAVAIIVLALYTFGPLSYIRGEHKTNPESIKPAGSEKVSINSKDMVFRQYHNKDVTENYYGVGLPAGAGVRPDTSSPGTYIVDFPPIKATIGLMDVPDNTTLELYVLGQEEPKLSKSVPGYRKTDFQKLTINGAEGYELAYIGTINAIEYRTVRTYVTGPDRAGVITLSCKESDYKDTSSIFSTVVNSFRWENR